MTKSVDRQTLPGTERHPVPGARPSGGASPDQRLEVTVRLRPKTPMPAPQQAGGTFDATPPAERHYLSREQFADLHGADPADIAQLESFAKDHGLETVHADLARRSVLLAGTVAQFRAAFGCDLEQVNADGGSFRQRTGSLSVPGDLGPAVEGVFGLDDRPQATPHFQVLGEASSGGAKGENVARPRAAGTSFTPVELAALYRFPTGLDGSGQTIGIIELGGGYRTADLKTYFASLKLPAPSVTAVGVDGGRNTPGSADSADGEVMLDIEVAAAVAPKAKIVVYFAPNTSQGFLDAITTAVHDATHKPSVISISWGGAESTWTAQAMTQYDQAFQAAAMMGVSVCCAAGDTGSSDSVADGKPHVDFSASSPFVLGCGGTRLVAANGAITAETVWNDDPTRSATGGGVSGFFPLPAYQAKADVPKLAGRAGRGVPDVAGVADPQTGYRVRVDGQDMVIGGTSAVAPLWAGLIALMNQRLGTPVGYLNPQIYGPLAGQGVFNDIVGGNNGSYAARPGWDACTGWGSPQGAKLLAALQNLAGSKAADA